MTDKIQCAPPTHIALTLDKDTRYPIMIEVIINSGLDNLRQIPPEAHHPDEDLGLPKKRHFNSYESHGND